MKTRAQGRIEEGEQWRCAWLEEARTLRHANVNTSSQPGNEGNAA